MKLGRIAAIAAMLLGLVLLPLTAALLFVLQAKGLLSLTWPTLDLGSLDPGAFFASLGTGGNTLHTHDLAARLMDASGRAGQTPCPGCVAGGTGGAGGGLGPSRPIDPFTRGWVRWWEEHIGPPIRTATEWAEETYRDAEEIVDDAVDWIDETWDSLFGESPPADSGSPQP